MADPRTSLVCLSQTQVVSRVLVKGLDAQRAAKSDHPRACLDVAHSTAFIDGFAANDATVIPISYIGIF